MDNTVKQSEFHSFAEFYPYYLQEHSNDVCRRLHYVGSLLVLSRADSLLTALIRHQKTREPVAGFFVTQGSAYLAKKRIPSSRPCKVSGYICSWVSSRTNCVEAV